MKVNCGSFGLIIKKSSLDLATNVNKLEGTMHNKWWINDDFEWYADSKEDKFDTNVEISLGASNGLTIKVDVPSTHISY
jgi:hypothetical protein